MRKRQLLLTVIFIMMIVLVLIVSGMDKNIFGNEAATENVITVESSEETVAEDASQIISLDGVTESSAEQDYTEQAPVIETTALQAAEEQTSYEEEGVQTEYAAANQETEAVS